MIAALRSCGLWQGPGRRRLRTTCKPPHRAPDPGDAERTASALQIWNAAQRGEETRLETYLRSRELCLPLPSTLRFHVGLKHPSGSVWPAMVALVTRGVDDAPIGIHRTFLHPAGGKAPVEPSKMMLGPCRGGAVRLAPPGSLLMVGEGIETCLAAMQATGHPTWAALSTSGMRSLHLPPSIPRSSCSPMVMIPVRQPPSIAQR